jgi:hypothetical protein
MPQILRHGANDFTSPPKEGMLRIFSGSKKNPTASAGSEPAILVTRGQHANHQTTNAAKKCVLYYCHLMSTQLQLNAP